MMIQLLSSLALLAAGVSGRLPDSAELRREELMAALKSGGYTIVLRHARTDRSFDEQRDPVPTERRDQRNLNDDGVRDARLMGTVFRKFGISFAEIISSPMYRCVETAEMAAGKPTRITMALRVFPSTAEQGSLVATAPRSGTNRLIVTHHFVIETHVPGINPGDIGESEAAVTRLTPDGKVELVGRITLDDWQALANPEGAKPMGDTRAERLASHGASPGTNGALHAALIPGEGRTVEIPDTHAGHVARVYLTAFNSGTDKEMKVFFEEWGTADPARPIAERLATYAKLFEEHGPLSVVSVQQSESLRVTLGIRSRRGILLLTVKTSESQPMRAESITFAVGEGAHR